MSENGGQVPDLGQLREVDPETAAKALTAAEMANGLRCNGCGERIYEGHHLFLLSALHGDNGVVVQTRRIAACSRLSCGYYEAALDDEVTYVEPVSFYWFSEDPATR